MMEDPEDRGYRSTRLWEQWQLHSDGRWRRALAGLFTGGKGARQSNAAASQQVESKGFSVRRKAATKEQSSTHAAKRELTLRRSRTPATVETSITRDPTESIAVCVLEIAHHP